MTTFEKTFPTDRDLFAFIAGARESPPTLDSTAGVPPTLTHMTSRVPEKQGVSRAADQPTPTSIEATLVQPGRPGPRTETVSPPSLGTNDLDLIQTTPDICQGLLEAGAWRPCHQGPSTEFMEGLH